MRAALVHRHCFPYHGVGWVVFVYSWMEGFSCKKTCWAWWAFPHTRGGMSERRPRTYVNRDTALWVIQNAPPVWEKVLMKVCKLVLNSSTQTVLSCEADRNRVVYFTRFWLSQWRITQQYKWLKRTVVFLSCKYDPP